MQKSKEEKWRKLATQYLKDCNGKIDDAVQEALELEEDRKAMEAEKRLKPQRQQPRLMARTVSSPTADDNVADGGDLENGGDDSDTGGLTMTNSKLLLVALAVSAAISVIGDPSATQHA